MNIKSKCTFYILILTGHLTQQIGYTQTIGNRNSKKKKKKNKEDKNKN